MSELFERGVVARREASRDRLAEIAMELFLERSVDDVSIEDIASRAGVTTRTFYRYFRSKQHVLIYSGSANWGFVTGAILESTDTGSRLEVVIRALARWDDAAEQGMITTSILRRRNLRTIQDVDGHSQRRLRYVVSEAILQRWPDEPNADLLAAVAVGVVICVGERSYEAGESVPARAEHQAAVLKAASVLHDAMCTTGVTPELRSATAAPKERKSGTPRSATRKPVR